MLYYVRCIHIVSVLQIQEQCFTVILISVQVIISLRRSRSNQMDLRMRLVSYNLIVVSIRKKLTHVVKNLAQIPILPFSFNVWYVFCVVGKLVKNLLHPFMYRMVSMCNQHYQWKIPTTLLALTSQEWR